MYSLVLGVLVAVAAVSAVPGPYPGPYPQPVPAAYPAPDPRGPGFYGRGFYDGYRGYECGIGYPGFYDEVIYGFPYPGFRGVL